MPSSDAPGRDNTMLSQERKDELRARCASNRAGDMHPFAGVEINTRAEVEWIMEDQRWAGERDSIGVPHADFQQAIIKAEDLSGIQLREANLSGAILEEIRLDDAYLAEANFNGAFMRGASLNRVDLEKASLRDAYLHRAQLNTSDLESADLSGAHLNKASLQQAILHRAILRGTELGQANLSGADLRESLLDSGTLLHRTHFDTSTRLGNTVWDGAPLNEIEWSHLPKFGEEHDAQRTRPTKSRAAKYREAARMYHGLVNALRSQGLTTAASKFRLREQQMERKALYWNGELIPWFFSWLLNVVAGYGERPFRTVVMYVSTVASFALGYFIATNFLRDLIPTQTPPLPLFAAVVLSVISFHGRGFFFNGATDVTDPLFAITALEGVIGLFIEAVFVAAFSRRFLGI
jgi:uncharacterized protein YjbI with pentapeptide repeats